MRLNRRVRRVLWGLALLLLTGIFFIAGRGDGHPPSNRERTEALARQFACPECDGQSVAASNAPVARNIRLTIAELVQQGRTDGEIRAHLVGRYGERTQLTPSATGFTALVWVVPVAVGVGATAALGLVLVQWRRAQGGVGAPDDADRDLVERFLTERTALAEPDR
ncbi:MAG: cytochrome c-type biogenesis protein CcmH [Acidimicrobiia bacterium]